jgi:hypothetical protein
VPPAPAAQTDGSSQPVDVWALLKAVAETAALFGFFLSVTGWSYLAAYYSFFAFRPMELDITAPVVALFAVSTLSRSALLLLILAVVFLVVYLVLRHFEIRLPRIGGLGLLLLLIIAALASHQWGSYLGRQTAREDILDTSSRLPSVGVYLRSARPSYPGCVSVTSPTIDCRMLLHMKGNYYLIEPFDAAAGPAQPGTEPNRNLTVYAVPDSQVLLVQYERGVQ